LIAHRRVPYDDKKIPPFLLPKVLDDVHDGVVNFPTVRLPKAHDQDAVVRHGAVLREPFICGDQRACLGANASDQRAESATP
jgi:hypothetical protein